jgi:hypothetical protein
MSKQTRLEIVSSARADTDWSIGYLDGAPAVGDSEGAWYKVSNIVTTVFNKFENQIWVLPKGLAGEWESMDVTSNWAKYISNPDEWTTGGPDYMEVQAHEEA